MQKGTGTAPFIEKVRGKVGGKKGRRGNRQAEAEETKGKIKEEGILK